MRSSKICNFEQSTFWIAPIIWCCSRISFRHWTQVLDFPEQYVIATENKATNCHVYFFQIWSIRKFSLVPWRLMLTMYLSSLLSKWSREDESLPLFFFPLSFDDFLLLWVRITSAGSSMKALSNGNILTCSLNKWFYLLLSDFTWRKDIF